MYIDFWHTIGYFIIGTEAFDRPQIPLIFSQTRQKNGRHHSHKRPSLKGFLIEPFYPHLFVLVHVCIYGKIIFIRHNLLNVYLKRKICNDGKQNSINQPGFLGSGFHQNDSPQIDLECICSVHAVHLQCGLHVDCISFAVRTAITLR